MALHCPYFQNMGMSSRNISPQSFDDMLSDLGNDPAIPDPNGIRKPGTPKTTPKIEISKPTSLIIDFKKIGLWGGLGVAIIGVVFAFFIALDLSQDLPVSPAIENNKALIELKNEIENLREDILDMQDDLYETIDLIEVSIHSFNKNKAQTAHKPATQTIPFEGQIRKMQYLGHSQIGSSEQVVFHNGTQTIILEKGGLLLGDWKLSHIDIESAILAHPQGKKITLKLLKPE